VLPRRHGRVAAARASLGRGRRVLEKVLVVVTGLGVGGAVVGGALVVCGAVGRGAVGRGAVGGAVVTLVGPGHGRGGGLVVGLGVIGVVRHRLHGRRDRADRRRSRGERGRGGHGSQGGRPGGVEQSFGLLVERPCRAPVGVGDERPRRRRVVRQAGRPRGAHHPAAGTVPPRVPRREVRVHAPTIERGPRPLR